MAKIVVSACAYLGDVAPFVPPANQLATRGHDVTFFTPRGFHSMLANEAFELATYPLDLSPSGMHADEEHERLMRHPMANMLRLGRYWMRKSFVDDPAAVERAVLETLDGADVVVSHPTTATVIAPAAEHLGIPMVVGQLFPLTIPTAEWTAPFGPYTLHLGRAVNRLSWRLSEGLAGYAFYDRELNRYRARLGQPALRGNALQAWQAASRTVMLVSRHFYGEGASDWPPVSWGGFSIWDGPSATATDPTVDEFVAAGEAPVLVTLGTSAATGAGHQFAAIGDALDEQGLRSLMLVGYERNLPPLRGRPGVFVFAPMTRVLPRCRAAVLSGALGGLAAALRAGVPTVVVPQLIDQVWNARRIEQLGVGIAARRPKDVGRALARIESDPSYRQRAAALAAAMAGEDGATALADAVEEVVGQPRDG